MSGPVELGPELGGVEVELASTMSSDSDTTRPRQRADRVTVGTSCRNPRSSCCAGRAGAGGSALVLVPWSSTRFPARSYCCTVTPESELHARPERVGEHGPRLANLDQHGDGCRNVTPRGETSVQVTVGRGHLRVERCKLRRVAPVMTLDHGGRRQLDLDPLDRDHLVQVAIVDQVHRSRLDPLAVDHGRERVADLQRLNGLDLMHLDPGILDQVAVGLDHGQVSIPFAVTWRPCGRRVVVQ